MVFASRYNYIRKSRGGRRRTGAASAAAVAAILLLLSCLAVGRAVDGVSGHSAVSSYKGVRGRGMDGRGSEKRLHLQNRRTGDCLVKEDSEFRTVLRGLSR